MGTSHRHGRVLGVGLMALVILAGMVGIAMILTDGVGMLDLPVGDSAVAILSVTMASLALGSLAYRGHPPWMSYFAKVAFGVRMLATGTIHSMNRLLQHLAYSVARPGFDLRLRSLFARFCYSMARHAYMFRLFPGGAGGAIMTGYNGDTRSLMRDDDSADLRDGTMLSANCGRERLSRSSSYDLRRWLSMPTRASPLVSFFSRLVSPATSATHARFSFTG